VLAGLVLVWSNVAFADAVAEAYARGNAAARRGDFGEAIEHYEHARSLLPARSAALSHDLGVAHAQMSALGPATFHLHQALRADPSPEVAESARRNLGIVRHRAELAAEASGAQLSAQPGGWDLLISALSAHSLRVGSLVCGVLALAAMLGFALERRGRLARRGWIGAVGLLLLLVHALGGVAHVLGTRATAKPRAVALPDTTTVRDGPGSHRKAAFELQGGAVVRIEEEAPGWCKIRMAGGLTGWTQCDALGKLDAAQPR
jgi:hypothetical protein